MSEIAKALNEQQIDHHVSADIFDLAQNLFLAEPELSYHFAHLWSHTTPRQQTLLSLIASQSGPYTYPQILEDLREKELIEGDKQASKHLIEDLTRLKQLCFLYERVGRYVFTSACLQHWINKNKPL